MAQKTTTGHHALFVGMPFQGHLTPSVDLAIKLAAHGFTVTFLHAHVIHHRISIASDSGDGRDIFADARAAGLDIRYELIHSGLPIHWTDESTKAPVRDFLFNKLPFHVEELLAGGGGPSVDCLIADSFYTWPSVIAGKFDIPYVSFWTQTATSLALFYHMDLLMANGHFACKSNRKDAITYIPGVNPLDPADLPSNLRSTDLTSSHHSYFKAFEGAKAAEFVIDNAVPELEPEAIAMLQQKQRFYAVGPIFSGNFKMVVKTNLFPESDCSAWLDSKPPSSVLYVSFGSIAHAGDERAMEEIAHGVLESKASFVWVARPSAMSSGEAVGADIPEGFVEKSKGRGLIVPWCGQREVLMHPAVGGFLTHGGWNSILESIWSGVPMICYPLYADQFTNRKLVVSDWKIGVGLGRVGEAVSRSEVSNTIDDLMGGRTGLAVKKAMEEIRTVVGRTMAAGGSSERNFQKFVSDLSRHIEEKKSGTIVPYLAIKRS